MSPYDSPNSFYYLPQRFCGLPDSWSSECLLTSKMQVGNRHDGLLVTQLLMTAYKSSEEGQKLAFDPKAVKNFVPKVAKGKYKSSDVIKTALRRDHRPGDKNAVKEHDSLTAFRFGSPAFSIHAPFVGACLSPNLEFSLPPLCLLQSSAIRRKRWVRTNLLSLHAHKTYLKVRFCGPEQILTNIRLIPTHCADTNY